MYFSFQLLDSRILVSGTLILDIQELNSGFQIPGFLIPQAKIHWIRFSLRVSVKRGVGVYLFQKNVFFRVRVDTNPNTYLTLTLKQHSLTKDRPRPTRSQFLPKVLGILVYMSRADIYTNFFHFFHSVLTPSNFLVQSVLIMFTQTLRFRA